MRRSPSVVTVARVSTCRATRPVEEKAGPVAAAGPGSPLQRLRCSVSPPGRGDHQGGDRPPQRRLLEAEGAEVVPDEGEGGAGAAEGGRAGLQRGAAGRGLGGAGLQGPLRRVCDEPQGGARRASGEAGGSAPSRSQSGPAPAAARCVREGPAPRPPALLGFLPWAPAGVSGGPAGRRWGSHPVPDGPTPS